MLARLLLLPALGAVLVAQRPSDLDALHYKLEIELLFSTSSIRATNHCTFRSEVNGLQVVELDLTSALAVSAVQMGGQPVAFSRPTNKLRVTLDRTYLQGESFTIDVDYGGQPPSGVGFGGFAFTSHSGVPMAWTLSQPWDARTWWPGKDQLGDKSTFEMWITHPDTMTAVSNGALQGIDTLTGNRLRTRWRESHPMIPYLASLAVTNYRVRNDVYTHLGANMPVQFWVIPENWNAWQSGMNAIVPMLTAFSDAYGQYPFVDEKYGIVEFTWGGGMEHQTVASQSIVDEWLSAHELAHQWWGDAITCATWHDIWLNEGFATFSEALWEERKPGGGFSGYLIRMRARKPLRTDGTVYVYNASSISNIFSLTNVYQKGAWAVHMLRGVLGEQDFWSGLAAYRQAYEGSSATTAQFQDALEQTLGRDLDWFFDQWIYNGGNVAYEYSWRGVQLNGQDYVHLELDQYQTSRPVFVMPVRIQVWTVAGREEHVVWNDQRSQQFVLPIGAAPTFVFVDRDEWILRGSTRPVSWQDEFFGATAVSIDVVQGGSVEFHTNLGPTLAGRSCFLVMGLSGSSPGTDVFGLQVPVNFDMFTEVAAAGANTAGFAGFWSTLDAAGRAVARFDLPAGIGVSGRGQAITAAALFVDQFDWASRPITIELR